MKILLVCEYWYGTGGWGYARVLREMGATVEVFDYRRSVTEGASSLPGWSTVQRLARIRRMNQQFVDRAISFGPDLVLVLKGEWLTPATLRDVKRRCSCALAQWYPDGPFNVQVKNATRDSIASIPEFDIYYIYARSLIEPLRRAGARRVEYLPFCYDPEMLKPPVAVSDEERLRYATDVVFAGTWDPDREWWLRHVTDLGVSVWGNLWDRLPEGDALRARWKGNAVYGEQISLLFAVSRIHLNFLREQNKDSNNVRTFEIPGFGGFLLTQRSEEQARELFEEDREIVCFSTVDELRDKIRYYLAHEDERLRIAEAGALRARNEHQAVHRLSRIIDDITHLGT